MKSHSFKQALALTFSVLLLAGCASTTEEEPVTEPEVTQTDTQETSSTSESETRSAPEEPEVSAEELAAQKAKEAAMKEQAALREVRTFYFDFDESSIKPEARASLAAHAAFLSSNPSVDVLIEGHCDERGTKEYNIALGERRAKSVARFLKVNGVSDAQIETLSYGEERPAVEGHNEQAWAKNRRAIVAYK